MAADGIESYYTDRWWVEFSQCVHERLPINATKQVSRFQIESSIALPSPFNGWSICGTFAVQEQGIGAMQGKKMNECKEKSKKPHREGLASIYLTTTATRK